MDPTDDVFVPVSDPTVAEDIFDSTWRHVRRGPDGAFELLKVPERIAAPGISNAHFSPQDEGRIAEAFRKHASAVFYAVVMEPLRRPVPVFRGSASRAGMHAFQKSCAHFNYVVRAPDISALVICSTDDFLVYAGSSAFVETCAGGSVAASVRSFLDYANDNRMITGLHRSLSSVCDAVINEYPRAAEGTFVRFPRA